MGWEMRDGKRYYYHTTCTNQRRGRVYLGKEGDPVAELAAAYADLQRLNLEIDRRARAKELADFRNGPIILGIIAATESLGKVLAGAKKALQDPSETGPTGPEMDRSGCFSPSDASNPASEPVQKRGPNGAP